MPSKQQEGSGTPFGRAAAGARRPHPLAARLLIVDDHDLARAGLRSLLGGESDLEVVGEASSVRQALALCQRLRPDVVLMDIRLPDSDGITATRALTRESVGMRVVIVTMHENPDYMLEALQAGAAGYVLKGSSRQEIIATIRQVVAGQSALQPELATKLLQRIAHRPGESGPAALALLTPREREVLLLVAQGQTNQQIGRALTLSVSTVQTHLEHIITKLGATVGTQAAVRAAQLGLLATAPA